MQKNQITITNSHKHKHNNYNNNKKKRQIEQKRVCVLPFLTSSVPNLRLDDLIIDANASGGELNANGGLGFEAEFVSCEPRKKVRFANAGVADQNNLEQVIVIVVGSVRPHFFLLLKKLGKRERREKNSNGLASIEEEKKHALLGDLKLKENPIFRI